MKLSDCPNFRAEQMTDKNGQRRGARGGHLHPLARLKPQQVEEIRRRRQAGETCASIGRSLGIGRGHVSQIATGRLWREING